MEENAGPNWINRAQLTASGLKINAKPRLDRDDYCLDFSLPGASVDMLNEAAKALGMNPDDLYIGFKISKPDLIVSDYVEGQYSPRLIPRGPDDYVISTFAKSEGPRSLIDNLILIAEATMKERTIKR